MDFDIDLAKKQSSDNPVYYIQYANARIHSLFAQAKEAGVKWGDWEKTDFTKLTEECELDLVKKMENYHMVIDGAAKERAPKRVEKYAYEEGVTQARLGLITAVQHVLVHALSILGVSAPERM